MGGYFSYFKSVVDAEIRLQRVYQRSLENCKSHDRRCPINLKPDDVMISGFGKTGTTWLQQIVHQLRTNGDESFDDIYNVIPFVPYYFVEYDTDLNEDQVCGPPRVFKSHEMYDYVPKNEEKPESVKYIVVFRDPLDTHLSLFKFVFRYYGVDADFPAEFLWFVLDSEVAKKGGSYWEFILSWFPRRNDSNVLWLHFEDLKNDLGFCLRTIADFLEISRTENELETIETLCTYDYMIKNKDRFRNEIGMKITCKTYNLGEWKMISSMVRPGGGKIGQGKQELSKNVQDQLHKRWEDTITAALGFKNYREFYEEMSLINNKKKCYCNKENKKGCRTCHKA